MLVNKQQAPSESKAMEKKKKKGREKPQPTHDRTLELSTWEAS